MKKETLLTISERTGFSISTISRVLNGQAHKYRISKRTVAIISEEAKKCNYKPSLLAKGLRTNKTNTVGLLVPGIDNPFFANIASVIICEAKKFGYTVVLVDTMESEQDEKEGIASLLARSVDGMIVVPCGNDPELLESVNAGNAPVVLVDRYYDNTDLSYVSTDNYKGAYDATRYLVEHGHKNILCIKGVEYSTPSVERVKGYMDALKNYGLENNARIAGESFSIRNGYTETKLALSSALPPTAIFATSNTILLGAIKAVKEAGLAVPGDISLISFDNYTYLDYLDPPITRISQPIQEIGTLAFKILMQRIEGKDHSDTRILLPPQMVVCSSVAGPAAGSYTDKNIREVRAI